MTWVPAHRLALAALLIGGCGPGDRGGPTADEADVDLETGHWAQEVCADGPTVFGIDVSKWQGDIDWDRVAAAGVRYAFIRTSHGLLVLDEKFERNWAEARRVGILRGVYQYFSPGQDAQDQANYVLDQLAEHGQGELPPVIDVEETDGRRPPEIVAAVGEWMDVMEPALGINPIIYSGRYFWQDNVGNSDAFSDHPLWHPQYTQAACPNIASAWDDWLFWQHSSTGRVDGIRGNVDMNRFNGSEEDLGLVADDLPPPDRDPAPIWAGEPKGQSFPLASEAPMELCVGRTLAGHMRVKNVGNQTWDDTVKLAPTPRDVASPLAAGSWLSPHRITGPDEPTPPGQEARFSFEIAGTEEGVVDQTFGLVAEGVAWFADEGGPPDDYLQLIVQVVRCDDSPPVDDPPDATDGDDRSDDPADEPAGDDREPTNADPEDVHEPRPIEAGGARDPAGAGGDVAAGLHAPAGKPRTSGCATAHAGARGARSSGSAWAFLPLRR